jgi:hypothetical protein
MGGCGRNKKHSSHLSVLDRLHVQQFSRLLRDVVDRTGCTVIFAADDLKWAAVSTAIQLSPRGDRVWFTLRRNPRFELTLAQSGCSIVLDKGQQFHGTGPFLFEHRPNLRLLQTASSIRLVRNPRYRGQSVVDEVEFVVLPADADGTPRRIVEALRKGEIDLTTSLPVSGISPSIN